MFFYHLTHAGTPGQINPAQTRLLQQYTHTSPMMGCRFDPSGRFVFGGAQDNTISRWDLTNGQKTTLAGHDSWVRALAFLAGQNTLISGGYDGKVIWWSVDAATPTPIRTVNAHNGW